MALAGAVIAAVPAAASAGGVVFGVGLPAPAPNVDAAGATNAVALPDGGAVLLPNEPGKGVVAAALQAGGVFQSSGTVRVQIAQAGVRLLRHGHRMRVRVSATFRDLLGRTARARPAAGALR